MNTKIVCESGPVLPNVGNDNFGNRGIDLITENGYTTFGELTNKNITNSATFQKLQEARLLDTEKSNKTIWMKGYLYPRRTGKYVFQMNCNGNAKFFLSPDTSAVNKTLVNSNRQKWGDRILEENTQ